MSDTSQTYILTAELRDLLSQQIGSFQKEIVSLQQSLREQETQATTTLEDLFLELLEVGDALSALITYLEDNPNPSPEFLQRFPRFVEVIHRKLLNLLEKRQVFPIQLEGAQPDFNLCRVVDREVRTDLVDQTITKIARHGFYWGKKILRPTEVIISSTRPHV
ncbi:MAG: nucleotide exchange factor GrpE [Rhizonema sp. NSF051]|nr:nucleotide exchange factor GrpE [Rhizonema sp. NSF051]